MSNILISLSHCPWLVAITLMLSSAHLVLISDLNLIILIPHELIIHISNVNSIPYVYQLDIYYGYTLGTHLLSQSLSNISTNNIINTIAVITTTNRNLNTIDVNDVINRSYSIIGALLFIDLLQIIRFDLLLIIFMLCVGGRSYSRCLLWLVSALF